MLDTKAYLKELLSQPVKDFNGFNEGVLPKIKEFDIRRKSRKGFNHIAFRSEKLSGHIDFWDSGMVEIYVVDNDSDKELIDVLLEADEKQKQKSAFAKLLKLVMF